MGERGIRGDCCQLNQLRIRRGLASKAIHLRPTTEGFYDTRPKRSERHLNYERLYQNQRTLPKSEGVLEGPLRKNHVTRSLRAGAEPFTDAAEPFRIDIN